MSARPGLFEALQTVHSSNLGPPQAKESGKDGLELPGRFAQIPINQLNSTQPCLFKVDGAERRTPCDVMGTLIKVGTLS
ncbi:hypothetical protein PCASD_11507 [Puccinia coronata f. sp. avenae]|uniref:Uncharacterized protein n=1 Tax=Puccinia coronata f. sp. avenae TaxID=200324 RepID=A0A2N5V3M1_9BASI|nr:hypothetical protein PCASD_11507 [Puccinia coronata f. sp. avenae]